MERLLHVSSSPHVRDTVTTNNIMYDVLIAMIPAAAFGVYQFGLNSLLVIILTMAACVLSEYIYEKAMKRPITIADGPGDRHDPGVKYAPGDSCVDSHAGRRICHYCG